MTLDADISTADALRHLRFADGDPTDRATLDRRRFLQLVGMGAGAGLVAGGAGSLLDWALPGFDPSAWAAGPLGPTDGILVVLGMYGGNDGLNTVIPINDGAYHDQRHVEPPPPQSPYELWIPAENTLPIDDETGLHPRLTVLKQHWDAGQLAIVEGVGYPHQDLSHFSSMAYWMAGRPPDSGLPPTTGWVGRWLDEYTGGRPDLYAACEIGSGLPLHLVGTASSGTGVPSDKPGWGSATDTRSERGYQAVRRMYTNANGPWWAATTQALVDGFDVAAGLAPYHPGDRPESEHPIVHNLEVAARLINANLGFRVLTAGWDDFDSHAVQGTPKRPAMHDARMRELNTALTRFYEVLDPAWLPRVTVMTFSEFGRTSWANNGGGTDHGSAAPHFVFGANVAGGRYGQRPTIAGLDRWERMAHHVDMRSYYASALEWLGAGSGNAAVDGYPAEILPLFRRSPGVIDDQGTVGALPTVIGGLSTFVPLTPARFADTRDGTGGREGPLRADGVLRVRIAGAGQVPAEGVTAVVANVTAVDATDPTYFTAYPGGTPLPPTSNINVGGPGRPVPNLVTIGVGLDGHIEVLNKFGRAHCLVDVFGYFTSDPAAAAARFVALTPKRLFDTRSGRGVRRGTLGHLERVDIDVAGKAGVPADATAVVLNLTVTGAEAPGYLRLTPAGRTPAETSNVNFFPGDTVPNLAIVSLGEGGKVTLDGAGEGKHAIGDVFGYFTAGDGDRLRAVAPRRLLDTREGLGAAKRPVGPDHTIDVVVHRRAGVPESATAVVLNVAATNIGEPSFLTVWPAGGDMPDTSNLNLFPGQTIANLVICRLGAAGALQFANPIADCDVIADVMGYFTE